MKRINSVQRDALSFNKRLLIKGILKYNVNIYSENSIQENYEHIIPDVLWSKQEKFIFSKIYQDENIDIEPLNVGIIGDSLIIAYTIYTKEEDDEIHFYYNSKDFSFEKILYFKESDTLEEVWQ